MKKFEIFVSDNAGLASSTLLQRAQDFLAGHAKTCSIVYDDEQQCDYAARSLAREFYARLDAAVRLHKIDAVNDDELPAFIVRENFDDDDTAGNSLIIISIDGVKNPEFVAAAYSALVEHLQAGGSIDHLPHAAAEILARRLDCCMMDAVNSWADDHQLTDEQYENLALPQFRVVDDVDLDRVRLVPSFD